VKKIPTMFARDWDGDRRYVLPSSRRGATGSVSAGEGSPTRKYDGTCVMFDCDRGWAQREVREGKTAPAGFVELEHDEETGKTVGWKPIEQSGFAKLHAQALAEAERAGGTCRTTTRATATGSIRGR
jgi:hypothetical protein